MKKYASYFTPDRMYRVFTWALLAALLLTVLLLMGLFLRPLPFPMQIVPVIVLLIAGWCVLRTDAVVEPRRVSRVQNVLIWIAILLDIHTLFHWLGFRYGFLLYCCGVRSSYLLVPPLVLIAVLQVVFRPFSKHARGTGLGIAGVLGGLLIWTVAVTAVDSNFAWRGKRLPIGYVLPARAQDAFFPENASDFEIEGNSGFLTFYVKWSCTVSEKDFDAFRKKHGYRFVLNRTDVNEDADVGASAWHDAEKWPGHYWFHNNRHANGGGLTMRYSIPERRLYGEYANR